MSKHGLYFVDGEEPARATRYASAEYQLSRKSFTMRAGHVQRQFDRNLKKPFGALCYPALRLRHASLRI